MSDYYVYNAEVYCEACGQNLIDQYEDHTHEDDGDSNTYPQGPYQDEEADHPLHCGSGEDCLDPMILPDGKVLGQFLENNLTSEGRDYVLECHREQPTPITTLWMEFYGLKPVGDSSDEIIDDDNRWAYE